MKKQKYIIQEMHKN